MTEYQTMIVYQTDVNGVFLGETVAHPSPLEIDVWAIPAGCVTVAPPEFGADQYAVWADGAWRMETVPVPEPEPEPEPQPVTLSKIDFCRALYAARILPADLVVDAALGKWPATFEAAIASLPEAARVDAKLAWVGATSVSRTAPLFLQLLAFFAAKQDLSPAQADALGDQIFVGAA